MAGAPRAELAQCVHARLASGGSVDDALAWLDKEHASVEVALWALVEGGGLAPVEAERALCSHPDWKPLLHYLDRTSERRPNAYTRLRLTAALRRLRGTLGRQDEHPGRADATLEDAALFHADAANTPLARDTGSDEPAESAYPAAPAIDSASP